MVEEDAARLELIKMLNWPEGRRVDKRTREWAAAFEGWLAERDARYHRFVGLRSRQAWREMLGSCGKRPWEVATADVNAYLDALEARGLRPKSIASLRACLESFYLYCQERGVDRKCGRDFNPVAAARRPKVVNYEKVRCLSEREEAALLDAIQQDDSPIGKRDYAMMLTLLRTGWKAAQVRGLKYGDLRKGEGDKGIGGSAAALRGEGLPAEVGAAIEDYLRAAGRLVGMAEDAYIFAPIRYQLTSERRERAEDWEGGRPISARQLSTLIKQHAEAAGLRAKAITCHTLRHTAAMRRLKRGETADAVGDFLGQKGKWGNRDYLRKLKKSPKGRLKARRRGNDGAPQVRSRKPPRFERRNHMALTHGLYARYLPEFEELAEKGINLSLGAAAELHWRIVVRRATYFSKGAKTVKEAAPILRAVGIACIRLVRAIKMRRMIEAMAWEVGEEGEVISEE